MSTSPDGPQSQASGSLAGWLCSIDRPNLLHRVLAVAPVAPACASREELI
jgi:hypothetical protein